MKAYLRQLWQFWPVIVPAVLLGAFVVAVAWLCWCGWYFNGH